MCKLFSIYVGRHSAPSVTAGPAARVARQPRPGDGVAANSGCAGLIGDAAAEVARFKFPAPADELQRRL